MRRSFLQFSSLRAFFHVHASSPFLFYRKLCWSSFLLFLILFTTFVAPWSALQSPVALAAGRHNPNPPLSPPAWLKPAHHGKITEPFHDVTPDPHYHFVPSPHTWPVSMSPANITVSSLAQHFLSNDGRLEIDISAGTVTDTQIHAAGGTIHLSITQVLPGAGGTNDAHISFGTYAFQLLDASGAPLSHLVLNHSLVLRYHLLPSQETLLVRGQVVYVIVRAGAVSTLLAGVPAPKSSPAKPSATSTAARMLIATTDHTGLTWSVSTNFTISKQESFAQTPNTISFNTQAPQATWNDPGASQVDLNSGSLTYNYPLDLPPGPGGFTPSLPLTYSSGGVSQNHDLQSAAPWVGEGWNISLGSISWSQENVTPGSTNKIENVWTINDSTGISGQLIPPDLNASTNNPPVPSPLPNPYVWHTAPESHAKVDEIMFGSYPCWRVFLPTGVIENFGCTDDSRQTYIDSSGHTVVWRWDLDLMIDRYGNQIQVTYQHHTNSDGSIRDAVLSTVEYDDPTCLNTIDRCTTWNPAVKIVFDASRIVTHLTNSTCQGWQGNNYYRCDDPVDLSGSGGLPVPKVVNSEALNDVKVEVQGNILRQYNFFYAQSKPQTITDPSSGQQESIAGYFTLSEVEQDGTGGTADNAPEINMQYTQVYMHYSDLYMYATPTTNCSPASWSPRDGNGACYLWSRTYSSFLLNNIDNGRGWNETVTWAEARNNTHGVDSGAIDDTFNCDGKESSSNKCGEADDKNWSTYAVQQRTVAYNADTSTWSYVYWLQTGQFANFAGVPCSSCHQGFTWGNQNDNDYADYYNGQFESFYKVQVNQPDGSYQAHIFGTTTGWGLADSSISCYLSSCVVASYFQNAGSLLATALAGQEQQEHDYDTNGALLKVTIWTDATNCPPKGVPNSGSNGGDPTKNPGQTQLISELDQNNPVVVCDPRVIGQDVYTVDGVSDLNNYMNDPSVVHSFTQYSHDTDDQGVSPYDYGNLTNTDVSGNDLGNNHFVTHSTFYPNDNLGSFTYLTDLPAITQIINTSGSPVACSQFIYNGNSSVTQAPTLPDVTQTQSHTVAGSSGCGNSSNLITVQHTYDQYGNAITGTDGDNHQGCANGSSKYSACAVYNSNETLITSVTNAENQVTGYAYDSSASGGYGQWLTSTTDVNSQLTSYQYDVLGRLTAVVRPGDSSSSPTVSYVYTNTCVNQSTTPCLELDTLTRYTIGGTPSTTKQWYDGEGRLIETQAPSPISGKTIVSYTVYDNDTTNGNSVIASLPYAISTPTGYVAPDLTQARSVTRYDGLGRSLGSVTYSTGNTIVLETTLQYTAAQGVPTISGESSNPYEQTITLDAYNHQTISYSDAMGRTRYTQYFSGTASPYSVIRTIGYTYDTQGDITATGTFDHTGTQQASYSATFDAIKRLTGFNDSDLGSCSNTPLPPGCSNSSDTAWKMTYDADGNRLRQTDPRNQTVYTSYDLLDRPLCDGITSASVNPCQSSSYSQYFYDSYNNTSNPTLTFPSGCTAPSGSYASDPVGRPTAEAFTGNGASGWRCYGYDGRGQQDQSSLSVTAADGQSLTQTMNMAYNDGGELTALVYPDGETLTSQYDVNGRFQSAYFGTASTPDPVPFLASGVTYTGYGQLASMALGGTGPKSGGASTTPSIFTSSFVYDGIQRPLSVSAVLTSNSQTVWSQARTYDNVGNVLGLSTTVPSISGGTKTDVESFCYDALNRLVWAGDTGTPSGGDHCGNAPSGTNITTYQQSYSYDDLDRMTVGPSGTTMYGDANHAHAATGLSTVANQYASYDADGNMICRNIASGTGHTCGGNSPNGAAMTYDAAGRLTNWTAPSGTTASDSFLYDNAGNRVLQTTSNTSNGVTTTTDTITFDSYTETSITNGATTTIKYYSVNGQKVAMHWNGVLYYLLSDGLGSSTVALKDDGTTQAAQLFAPYGAVRHSSGTMPTTYNFTGQRLDSETGLLYYNFRYYDPISGRFVRADTVDTNAGGMDPYAYVGDSPENGTDPTGRDFIPLWWLITGAGAAGVGIEILAGTSLVILYAPPARYGANYSANGPQPSPAPTPDESPTPEPTPQTNTNGGMCRTGGCYDLSRVEGYAYPYVNANGSMHTYYAHTIANHVNVSDASARLKTSLSNSAGGKGVLSVFNNLNDAEWAVQYALDHPSVPLSSVTPGSDTTFSVDTGVNIGWGYQRGNPNKVTNITSVTVWLYVTPDGQLVVMDAFPTLEKYSPPPPPPPAPPTQPTHGYAP